MRVAEDLAQAVGNTPLIRLRKASEETGCDIYGKAEFLNPGQSVKDRAALFIIRDAIARGDLRPGGTIVEGTAGNTGIGLALVGASMGFKTVIVIPETQSQEKKDMIRLAGAELVEVPAVPYSNPDNYVRYSGRLAEEMARRNNNGAIWANQFDNVANRQAHIDMTGPEIWEQTGGKVDGFVCAVGSGGTLAGVGAALQPKGVKVALADPMGSGMFTLFRDGKAAAEGSSITEGIGQGRITANLEGFTPDMMYQIPDDVAIPIVFDLLRHEGHSIKYRRDTPLKVILAAESVDHHYVISVSDNGIGISPKHLERVFEPFFRADKSNPISGTGIGLSFSRQMIERHGGKLWAESVEGEGSEFLLSLPKEHC
ncbi:MAG: cysteine synthase A [Pseudomonadota bacterium]